MRANAKNGVVEGSDSKPGSFELGLGFAKDTLGGAIAAAEGWASAIAPAGVSAEGVAAAELGIDAAAGVIGLVGGGFVLGMGVVGIGLLSLGNFATAATVGRLLEEIEGYLSMPGLALGATAGILGATPSEMNGWADIGSGVGDLLGAAKDFGFGSSGTTPQDPSERYLGTYNFANGLNSIWNGTSTLSNNNDAQESDNDEDINDGGDAPGQGELSGSQSSGDDGSSDAGTASSPGSGEGSDGGNGGGDGGDGGDGGGDGGEGD